MSPIEEVLAWVQAVPEFADYVPSRGAWTDSPTLDSQRILSLVAESGGTPGVIERYPRIRVLVVGKRDERSVAGAVAELNNHAEILAQRVFAEYKSGCLTQIRMIGDIIGPGYTVEGRPWFELNFELTV